MAGVSLQTISKSFGDNTILKGIDVQVHSGEFMVIVGPSGCGKSTLLRIIAGLETPDGGDVIIDGERKNDTDPSKREVAMVFQNYALYPTMTVYENLAFSQRIRKRGPNEIDRRVMESSKMLKIEELLDRKPKELSGGQRQRVALGRALVRKPKVFLFDEPLSNLDAKLRQEMRLEIKKLHTQLGTTMIYVTHDQTEAMTMADRICLMNDGNIEQIGTPEELYNKPANTFVATFIGMPPINLIDGQVCTENGSTFFTSDGVRINLDTIKDSELLKNLDEHVILGIRPEDLHDNYFAEIKDPKNTITCTVDLVENLGSVSLVHSHSGNTHLSASLKMGKTIHPGDSIDLIADVNSLHFFNKETMARISLI
jgi:multiple sugar transport system ATP-binding protein